MNKGFTLIELMISIVIGMLVVGLGSAALNQFNNTQKVKTTSQELISNLRLARSYAVSGQLPDGGDKVAVVIDNNGLMTIWSQGSSESVTFLSKDITPNGVGITFLGVGNTNVFLFSMADGRSIGGATTAVVSGDDGTTNTINIDQSGLIYGK
jgi:prepilin-type N-terminal cleavage/methylation domain-containing protein